MNWRTVQFAAFDIVLTTNVQYSLFDYSRCAIKRNINVIC